MDIMSKELRRKATKQIKKMKKSRAKVILKRMKNELFNFELLLKQQMNQSIADVKNVNLTKKIVKKHEFLINLLEKRIK